MFKIDGSWLCWMIYADYLDDNGGKGDFVRFMADETYEYIDITNLYTPHGGRDVGAREWFFDGCKEMDDLAGCMDCNDRPIVEFPGVGVGDEDISWRVGSILFPGPDVGDVIGRTEFYEEDIFN